MKDYSLYILTSVSVTVVVLGWQWLSAWWQHRQALVQAEQAWLLEADDESLT
jgi:heme exporter protein D